MTYANPAERKELIAGLRALATFLEQHPDVPSPRWEYVMVFPSGTDVEMRTEIDRIAAMLATTPTSSHGHYRAIRSFGPIEYRAVAIPDPSSLEGSAR